MISFCTFPSLKRLYSTFATRIKSNRCVSDAFLYNGHESSPVIWKSGYSIGKQYYYEQGRLQTQ